MANHRFLRGVRWWRKLTKREWAVFSAALATVILTVSFVSHSHSGRYVSLPANHVVPFTPLSNAHKKAAFCLDGSVPGYHFQQGFGSGSDNWLLHIEGGGWCDSIESCSSRATRALGSSMMMEHEVLFSGIMSHEPSQNPDFFNWNKVKIRYCDGASFAGHPESELKNGTKLFFRGQLIWEALMDEFLSIGLSEAKKAFLTGCSAGGLAALIHCDNFREILPKNTDVKCLADASFFLNEKDVAGNPTIENFYRDVVNLQGVAKSLNKDCVSRTDPYKCFFPQEFINNIKTPVFLVNPSYDFWQIRHILVPEKSDPHGSWRKCALNINYCNSSQLEVLQGFRNSLLSTLGEFQKNAEGGMFINSCFIHCQTWITDTWHSSTSPKINSRTIAESVGDWYFNRKPVKYIDVPFPGNPTCYNMDLTSRP
ncbi:PREDICTED: pectin acetylesterase 5-like [Ipomoea nil]|uniref:pectin acetylesterase 5-like n=1 Tax=Ipomoea nil TaxID=35883 RepID=UPI000901353A|nr:PREDICTED: pectin acetylesterase 5-like [Ipomoea nil]XP_019161757.1 PREDICTED: pectin acetylesterase 5-like [Ipomoea nil]